MKNTRYPETNEQQKQKNKFIRSTYPEKSNQNYGIGYGLTLRTYLTKKIFRDS